jgi:hypothetical protein
MPEQQKESIGFIELCIILLLCTTIAFLEGGEYIFSEYISYESDFQVNLKENVNYKIWVVDLNGPEKISVRISKGSCVAFEDTFMLMHPEGDYLPYHPKFSVKESGAYQVHVKPLDTGTVRLGITISRIPNLL